MTKIANIVSKYLTRSGYNVSYLDFSTKIQEYLSWYRGKTKWHEYKIYNGAKYLQVERASLDMAKTCCEDFASLMMNEKVKITMGDDESQKFINSVLKREKFRVQGNQLTELAAALGTGAFVESWVDRCKIDYIQGDMIFPLKWDNGEITECAFGIVGGDNEDVEYTLLMHVIEEGKYVIKVVDLDKKGTVVRPLDLASGLRGGAEFREIIYTGSEVPLFQIIKPNIVNNYDKTSPLGISIFGNSIDILKSLDAIYDSWLNEFILGKKRIFVKSDLKRVQIESGSPNVIDCIDVNDTLFYQLEWTDGDVPIHETDFRLRYVEHIESIDAQLKLFSRKVGLGDSYYAFNNGNVGRTATEVISTNSALYKNVCKNNLVFSDAIIGMCKGLLSLENIFNNANYDVEQEITVDFDDSIIIDTDKQREQALIEYNAGLIDRVEYFVLTRDMTRQQAEKFVAEMDATDTMKQTIDLFNNVGVGE